MRSGQIPLRFDLNEVFTRARHAPFDCNHFTMIDVKFIVVLEQSAGRNRANKILSHKSRSSP
jgi:hypothetical protein